MKTQMWLTDKQTKCWKVIHDPIMTDPFDTVEIPTIEYVFAHDRWWCNGFRVMNWETFCQYVESEGPDELLQMQKESNVQVLGQVA